MFETIIETFSKVFNPSTTVVLEAILTLSIMYGDIVTDIIVNIGYYENGDTWWFVVGMICLSISYLLSFVFGLVMLLVEEGDEGGLKDKSFCNRLTVFILGTLWLAPAIPAYDLVAISFGYQGFFADKDDAAILMAQVQDGDKNMRFEQMVILAKIGFKLGETVAESIPQAILQTYVLLNQEDYSGFQVFSVCLSFASISLSVYVSYDFELFDQGMNKIAAAIFEGVYVAYIVLALALFTWAYKYWLFVVVPLMFGIEIYVWFFFTDLSLLKKLMLIPLGPFVISIWAFGVCLVPIFWPLIIWILEGCTCPSFDSWAEFWWKLFGLFIIYLPVAGMYWTIGFATVIFSPIIFVAPIHKKPFEDFFDLEVYSTAWEISNLILDLIIKFALIFVSLEYYEEFDLYNKLPHDHEETASLIYFYAGVFTLIELICGCVMIGRCSLKTLVCCGGEKVSDDSTPKIEF